MTVTIRVIRVACSVRKSFGSDMTTVLDPEGVYEAVGRWPLAFR